MFNWRNAALALACACACAAKVGMAQTSGQTGDKFANIGRTATPAELAAWDIDVNVDFKGLPPGAGSVAQGQVIWEAKCASCHGVFGESNQVFNPLIGGTSAQDVKSGRVASLTDRAYPGRTTLMKLATLSTLWDYINRAMPWTQPKSLTPNEVYAVTAFMLNLGGVVADDFTLSHTNMAATQARLPNRNGMSTAHAMWPGAEFAGTAAPDVRAIACMADCAALPTVASSIPDFARNAHGNLALQNRTVGPQRGVDTAPPEALAPPTPPAAGPDAPTAIRLATQHSCTACHGMSQKGVGPAFTAISQKYPLKADYLAGKIKSGGSGVWGAIPMPAQALSEADAKTIAAWLAAGAAAR